MVGGPTVVYQLSVECEILTMVNGTGSVEESFFRIEGREGVRNMA